MNAGVSIVMPVRNAGSTVSAAIRSIMLQSLPDWELIVVDDGSTDDTVPLLREWAAADTRVELHLDGRSMGISARLNQGVRLSTAPLVARMDGDDVCYPHRLGSQVEFLHRNPEVDLVGAAAMVFCSDGAPRGVRSRPGQHADLTARPVKGIPMAHPTWMGRRSWFARHPYDVRFAGCEDAQLLLRTHSSSRFANMPDILIGYREDRIKLRRSLTVRAQHAAFLVPYGLEKKQLCSSLAAATGHLAKGVRDVLAVASRGQDLVLNRRNGVPTPAELAAWRDLWASVTCTAERVEPSQ